MKKGKQQKSNGPKAKDAMENPVIVHGSIIEQDVKMPLANAKDATVCLSCGTLWQSDAIHHGTCDVCRQENSIISEMVPEDVESDVIMIARLHAMLRPLGSGNLQLFLDRWIRNLPHVTVDGAGNFIVDVDVDASSTIFTSHTDTVGYKMDRALLTFGADEKCGHSVISRVDSVLGSDDSAGIYVMLKMIEAGVPGRYIFFHGEESGCIGSSRYTFENVSEIERKFDRVISFDRRGTDSVITSQMGGDCCSTEFANALCSELNAQSEEFSYKLDPTGTVTDSAEFMDIVPECTNISVGYYGAHSSNESLNVDHLIRLAQAAIKVDWESLPTRRDPYEVKEVGLYGKYGMYGGGSSSSGFVYHKPSPKYYSYDDVDLYMQFATMEELIEACAEDPEWAAETINRLAALGLDYEDIVVATERTSVLSQDVDIWEENELINLSILKQLEEDCNE